MRRRFRRDKLDALIKAQGGVAQVARRIAALTRQQGWDAVTATSAERRVMRAKEGRDRVEQEVYESILVACGVPALYFEEYLLPVPREQPLLTYDDALSLVAGWDGNPSSWQYGRSDPLSDLAACWRAARHPEEKAYFLLLEAHAAVKAGERHLHAFVSGGRDQLLLRLAQSGHPWISAAASWHLGKLYSFRASAEMTPQARMTFARLAHEHFAAIRAAKPSVPILLPGAQSELPGLKSPPGNDPFVTEFQTPTRYLSTAAVALAHTQVHLGEGQAAGRLFLEAESVWRGQAEMSQPGLNRALCAIAARVFRSCLKFGGGSRGRRDLYADIASLRERIDQAFQCHLISPAKANEWLGNLDCAELALRRAAGNGPSPAALVQRALGYVEVTVKLRGGRGCAFYLFDPVYQFALGDDEEASGELKRIIST